VSAALLAIDVTEEVVDEAIKTGCNFIISHHPVIFHPLKNLTGRTVADKIVTKAIRNNIAIYSAHTNLDTLGNGVSMKMAEKLEITNISALAPLQGRLMKLVTYVPDSHIEKVRKAVFNAGAGVIGNYDMCSFNAPGYGTFRGNESTQPFAGEKLKLHRENEIRFETILQSHIRNDVVRALTKAHPYEEVAYDLYLLENEYPGAGMGCIGTISSPSGELEFLKKLGDIFGSQAVRYSPLTGRTISKVALCGGAGAGLTGEAIASGADIFITGDVKYHDFQNASGKILLADIGHFESEKFATEIFYDLIIKKFPTFALRFSEINTNPINYL
jgi:dinuclear metal center YbgI/SA1388 family protein